VVNTKLIRTDFRTVSVKRVNQPGLTVSEPHTTSEQRPNTLEQMFESVGRVLYRHPYGTDWPEVLRARIHSAPIRPARGSGAQIPSAKQAPGTTPSKRRGRSA